VFPHRVSRPSLLPKTFLPLCLLLAGCAAPPAPAPTGTDTKVAVGVDVTWDAVIEHFALNNIPISTIERASGLIATTHLDVPQFVAVRASDCGIGNLGDRVRATSGVYNVLVRGDERSSTVQVTASWSSPAAGYGCSTTRVWEDATQEAIKNRAEGEGEVRVEILIETGRWTGGPFPVPEWARVIARVGGSTFYPLTETCTAWYGFPEGAVRYFASAELALRQGLHRSSAEGC
jgi:hypothetical protein